MIATVLLACTFPTLAACGAGFTTDVDEVRAENAAADLGGILARDIVVVKAPQATSAALAGTLINRGQHDDTLQTIAITDDAPGSATITITPNLAIAAGQLVPLGAESHQPLTITDAHGINVGDFLEVVMHFAQAGDMRMQVATADRAFYFSSIGPAPASTAAATEAAAASRATASGTRIVTDKATPSPAPKAPATKPAADAKAAVKTSGGKAPAAKPTATPAAKSTAPAPAVKPAAKAQ
jgi:hypothetical protein